MNCTKENFDAYEDYAILIQCTSDLNEINQLRTVIKEYEELVGEYKVQVEWVGR